MQKFYIHKDDQQQGPFSIEELKDLKITRDTMVWFEGADDWKQAIEVDDLKEIFKSIPPPLIDKKPKEISEPIVGPTPRRKSKTLLIIVLAILLVGGSGTLIYINQQTKQSEIQSQIEVQNAKIQKQEKIEAARLAEEERQKREANAAQRQAELESLKIKYDQAIIALRAANISLDEIKQFQLMRTSSEKQQQIRKQLEIIKSWEVEVDRLKKEIDSY